MVEAILWDNDGVLVDSERLYYQATRETLARIGADLTLELYQEHSLRRGMSTFHLAVERGLNPEEVLALRAERDVLYQKLLRSECRTYPGVEDVLRELHGKVRMAIVTSSLRSHFDVIHKTRPLEKYFDFVLTREDYKKSKPHPEPYEMAVRHFGLPVEHCIAIEDTERGLVAARAARLRCVIVPNEFTRGCAFEGAAAVLEDIRELPGLVEKL